MKRLVRILHQFYGGRHAAFRITPCFAWKIELYLIYGIGLGREEMAVITSTVGMQAAIQGALQQLKAQQAKQNADRAEQTARVLSTKASEAQQVAVRAQENARSLTVQADQAHTVAGQARQGVVALNSASEMQVRLFNTAQQVSERIDSEPVKVSSQEAPPPVLNTSGQLTGVVVNTTA